MSRANPDPDRTRTPAEIELERVRAWLRGQGGTLNNLVMAHYAQGWHWEVWRYAGLTVWIQVINDGSGWTAFAPVSTRARSVDVIAGLRALAPDEA